MRIMFEVKRQLDDIVMNGPGHQLASSTITSRQEQDRQWHVEACHQLQTAEHQAHCTTSGKHLC